MKQKEKENKRKGENHDWFYSIHRCVGGIWLLYQGYGPVDEEEAWKGYLIQHLAADLEPPISPTQPTDIRLRGYHNAVLCHCYRCLPYTLLCRRTDNAIESRLEKNAEQA